MLNRVLALFLISSTAVADEGKFTLLAEQEVAPFEGVLFDPVATATIITEKNNRQTECDLEVEYQLDKANTEFALERKNSNIRYEALQEEYKLVNKEKDKEITALQEALKKQAPSNKWIWFSIAGAAGATAALIVAKQFTN